MAWWQDALCAIGLATCAPPQPDVSAHTILNLLIQSGGDAEVFPLALGALYETVDRVPNGDFALGRDGETFAYTQCSTPLFCTFTYLDNDERLKAFALQARMWTEHNVGPIKEEQDGSIRAQGADLEIFIGPVKKRVLIRLNATSNP